MGRVEMRGYYGEWNWVRSMTDGIPEGDFDLHNREKADLTKVLSFKFCMKPGFTYWESKGKIKDNNA